MINFNTIKENANKTLEIKKNSPDSWKLGEIMTAIAFDKLGSDFEWSQKNLDVQITKGYVKFNNKCIIKIT